MQQKILFICLASYHVPNLRGYDPDARHREEVYAVALSHLLSTAPREVEFLVVDNTATSVEELSPSLQVLFQDSRIKDVVLVNNNQLGAKNRGAGEYVMCRALLDKHSEYINNFDWVVYYTSRYPLSFPLVFEYLERYADKQAIVSNATYLYADGSNEPSAPGNYNDVIFAMKPRELVGYIGSLEPERLAGLNMNSETNLYNYIHENKLDFQEVYRWGLLRYNYGWHKSEVI